MLRFPIHGKSSPDLFSRLYGTFSLRDRLRQDLAEFGCIQFASIVIANHNVTLTI